MRTCSKKPITSSPASHTSGSRRQYHQAHAPGRGVSVVCASGCACAAPPHSTSSPAVNTSATGVWGCIFKEGEFNVPQSGNLVTTRVLPSTGTKRPHPRGRDVPKTPVGRVIASFDRVYTSSSSPQCERNPPQGGSSYDQKIKGGRLLFRFRRKRMREGSGTTCASVRITTTKPDFILLYVHIGQRRRCR